VIRLEAFVVEAGELQNLEDNEWFEGRGAEEAFSLENVILNVW
jgi:hypothetical protein